MTMQCEDRISAVIVRESGRSSTPGRLDSFGAGEYWIPACAGMTNRGRFARSCSLSPELPLQFALGPLQPVALRLRQALAGTVDIEGQHRERRAIGAGLAARTPFRRALQ